MEQIQPRLNHLFVIFYLSRKPLQKKEKDPQLISLCSFGRVNFKKCNGSVKLIRYNIENLEVLLDIKLYFYV